MSLNSRLKSASALGRVEWGKRMLIGLLVSLSMACSTVGLAVILPGASLPRLAAVIVAPFLIALAATRNGLMALTLVWLNEQFVGVGGTWITLGPVNGRALLLACLIAASLLAKLNRGQTEAKEHKRNQWVLFYGLVLPVLLAYYAVTVKDVAGGAAFSDVSRFGAVLAYFPVYYCLKTLRWFMVGWLLGATGLLAVLFVLLAMAPGSISLVLMEKWIEGLSLVNSESIVTGVLATGRASFVPLIYCLIGLFLGLVVVIMYRELFAKTVGFCIVLATASAFVVNFIRGPILGIIAAVLILFVGLMRAAAWRNAAKLATIVAVLVAGGFLFTVTYLPTSFDKWQIVGEDMEEIINPVRVEQTQLMLKAWSNDPLLGSGVGSPIANYSRTDEGQGLAFEEQYPMVLYRTGIVGFIVILAPFILFIGRSLQLIVRSPGRVRTPEGLINMAMCGAVMALLVASIFNPYLASSMAVVFIVIFIASDSAIRFPVARIDRRPARRHKMHKNA